MKRECKHKSKRFRGITRKAGNEAGSAKRDSKRKTTAVVKVQDSFKTNHTAS